ncbi:glycosyltransferase [Geobacillus thermodenitrificans]|jgi:glycosyltransferase involved in cell wall biosynthesis|uniref:glycosyltransferase n=1 Tax=Geobacillus thermodenitrificans TaxID=33940 RepID=UPI002DFB2CFD|nr:glycosyltransferase involved in cell wall biosynthesis [Geobacillus thermodenitrificans]MED0663280.1 glycosyl transferase family 2 [Geobacillus thermodenitrificans]
MDSASINKRLDTIAKKKKQIKQKIALDQKLLKNLQLLAKENGRLKIEEIIPITPKEGVEQGSEDYVEKYLKQREKLSDLNFFQRIEPLVKQIPDSNGSRYFRKKNIHVGIIADEFLYQAYKDVANFYYITSKNYKDYKGKLDILLVVTTWRGLNNEWRGVANPASNRRKELYQIIEFYKRENTKVVFYSKEDPVNYEKFIEIAKKCDYIFTTAKEKVNDYKAECANDNVFVLEFGVNPLYHNPIGMRKFNKFKDVIFSGSWLAKYPERQKETEEIFDGVLNAGRELKIIDRNFWVNHPDYFFPERYLPYISPSISHEYLQKVHKLFNWAINFNSVKFSETMFANRVYELQAIGNILISNYSLGVNNKFPNVFMINEGREVGEIINSFTDDEIYRYQVEGIRNVMSNHTTFHRFNHLLELIGLQGEEDIKKVAVVVEEINQNILDSFEAQTYKYKQLVLKEQFNEELKQQFDVIAFFHPDQLYDHYYLEDMVNGFKYTACDYITKDSYYDGDSLVVGKEHDYVGVMKSKFRTVFWASAFSAQQLLQLEGEHNIPNGYSIDRFEYNAQRKPKVKKPEEQKYALSVIIPVFNNGKHLLYKCFGSLKRSSIFNKMEIILVDDGSKDPETNMIIERLNDRFSNVKVFRFYDGGSGSASRPRNKGVELSTAPYITFLDPDNEAVNDGYAKLLDTICSDPDLDMVIGNMTKLDNTKKTVFNYYKITMATIGTDTIRYPRQFLIDTGLRAQSIQALVVKRDVIINNKLRMVEKAAGQDTMFFQQLMLHSRKVKVIDLDIHIYYAAVSESVTNSISKKFFEKYLTLERERLPFLKMNNLLDIYMQKRFTFYFKNWYLKRLVYLNRDEAKEALDTLYHIFSLYKDYIVVKDKEISLFEELYKKGDYEGILERFKG